MYVLGCEKNQTIRTKYAETQQKDLVHHTWESIPEPSFQETTALSISHHL